jgi:hypothetical protein
MYKAVSGKVDVEPLLQAIAVSPAPPRCAIGLGGYLENDGLPVNDLMINRFDSQRG